MSQLTSATQDSTPWTQEARLVASIRQVPSCYREFAQTAQVASEVHRIKPDLLARLVELGLPHAGMGDDALFDSRDLLNASAGLGLRSAWFFGQRGWTQALARMAEGASVRYDVELRPRCPYPGHPGECEFTLRLAAGEPAGATAEDASDRYPQATMTGPWSLTVRTGRGCELASAEVAEVLSAVADAEYLNLPVQLEQDLGFFDRTGLANCSLAAAVVARQAQRLGVPVRRSFGLVLLPPYAGLHNWIDFKVGGNWQAYDPHLIRYLETARILTPGWWPGLRSISGMLLRLGLTNSSTALMTHNGLHSEASFPMRLVS